MDSNLTNCRRDDSSQRGRQPLSHWVLTSVFFFGCLSTALFLLICLFLASPNHDCSPCSSFITHLIPILKKYLLKRHHWFSLQPFEASLSHSFPLFISIFSSSFSSLLSFPHFLPLPFSLILLSFLLSFLHLLLKTSNSQRGCSEARPRRRWEKKGRDHQLADGGMQKRYRLEGSSIGLLSPPSPLPSLCASHQPPPLFLCQGGMTCWITKQPSHVSACSLCQPRDKRYQAPGALMRATERRRRRAGGKKKEMSKEESEWESE